MVPVMKASGAMTSARVARCRYHSPSAAFSSKLGVVSRQRICVLEFAP